MDYELKDNSESKGNFEFRIPDSELKTITILGSTGSIGTQALEIIRSHPDELRVGALSANKNIELLKRQISEFSPDLVCVYDKNSAEALKASLKAEGINIPVKDGMEGLCEIAAHEGSDMVLTAVVGMVGIRPTLCAIHAGKDIALANKETLVCAGRIIISEAARCGVRIYPVDSEHSAIFQCLNGEPKKALHKIILTASGGPFRGYTEKQLENVTAADALHHPNWSMGKKITIDSATLANKGLEVMEAGWLFGVSHKDIQVVIQPQSVIHSAVEFEDGAVIAQLGTPDMKIPIQYAFFYPERSFLEGKRLDFFELGSITFEKPDTETFRALALAYRAMDEGGSAPCVFNAANERAVASFLRGEISFLEIAEIIEKYMNSYKVIENPNLEDIIAIGEEIICS